MHSPLTPLLYLFSLFSDPTTPLPPTTIPPEVCVYTEFFTEFTKDN